jgi:drug/metabolite transporter (DMT)-like permease
MVSATPREVFGVNLINYLWPVLTVLLSAWWVPGAHLTPRIAGAAALSLAGLAWANLAHVQKLLDVPLSAAAGTPPGSHLLPYALAFAAALSWAAYSASLARWRSWAGGYATSPAGFLLTGLVAGWAHLAADTAPLDTSGRGLWLTLSYGVGPLAVGYLLWEMALARARVHALSLLGAVTPVLSTLVLCIVLRVWPGFEVVAGAVLVTAGALLSVRR